jgi:glycopeptide antibiotics resistance protein
VSARSVEWRRGWWTVAACYTAVILVATLMPESEPEESYGLWFWSRFDVAQNLALFAPLGVASFLATRSHVKSVLLGSALSLAVELLQLHVIRGRDASVADWISNSVGTLAGAGFAAVADSILRRWRIWRARRGASVGS